MASIASKLGFRQSIGVYNDGESIHAVRLVASFGKPREAERHTVPVGGDSQAALAGLLNQLGARAKATPIILGVPEEKCYFATRPVSVTGGASPKVLLRESLRSSTISVERMQADTVTSRPDRRDVVGIVGCERSYIESACAPFVERKLSVAGAEPAPCALLRLAAKQDRAKLKEKLVVRVFLNNKHVLAILTSGIQPIVWRSSALASGDEAATMLALVRSLVTVSKPSGVEREPDVVVIHGRHDLERLIDVDWVQQHLATNYRWIDGPALDGGEIALGLAMREFEEEPNGFDLARDFAIKPTLLQIFPWRELAACAALMLTMTGLLLYRNHELRNAASTANLAANQLVAPSIPTSDLQREKKELEAKVAAVRGFLDSRVVWSKHLRDMSNKLPDNIYLTSINGDAEYKTKNGKAGAKSSFVIKGAVSLAASGLVPHEVDSLVDTIRQHTDIAKDFPLVELADLKQFRRVGDDQELALFTIMCLPMSKKGNDG